MLFSITSFLERRKKDCKACRGILYLQWKPSVSVHKQVAWPLVRYWYFDHKGCTFVVSKAPYILSLGRHLDPLLLVAFCCMVRYAPSCITWNWLWNVGTRMLKISSRLRNSLEVVASRLEFSSVTVLSVRLQRWESVLRDLVKNRL